MIIEKCHTITVTIFSQLFGEDDPDQDVSPDTADPEAAGSAGLNALDSETESGNVQRTSTHHWAKQINYEPSKLFDKFFKNDIDYLLTMGNLTMLITVVSNLERNRQ